MHVHLTLRSSNAKTGPIPVSTSTSTTCPDSCPFKSGGCYASHNPRGLGGHWRKVTTGERGTDWTAFCASVSRFSHRQLWRHNQAGDLPGRGERINGRMMNQLVRANRSAGARGFAYTHKQPGVGNNAKHIASANAGGFTVNLSGNNPVHADKLADLGIAPVVTVIPDATVSRTPAGRKIVLCPAQRENSKIQCASCGLCAIARRPFIIGFLPHGNGAKAARVIASQTAYPPPPPHMKYNIPSGATGYTLVALQEPVPPALLSTGDTPEGIHTYLRKQIPTFPTVETAYVVMLSTRRKILGHVQISQGTLDTLLVHPREVFRAAIIANASAIVLVHNHPSGDPTPSEADIRITRDLARAGQLLRIDLLDHIVVGHPAGTPPFQSLRQLGYFYA